MDRFKSSKIGSFNTKVGKNGYKNQKKIDIYRYFLGVPKTLYFNFKYFKVKDAVKLPVIISHKVKFENLGGEIELKEIKPAIVRIGFGNVSNYDFKYSRTVLDIHGKIIFTGKAKIGHGSKLSVHGTLEIGDKFQISAESSIICRKHIKFGDRNLLSWENIIMDSDYHDIYDFNHKKINENAEIEIGDNVWIGCRNMILKGTKIGNNIIIGSNSTITGKFTRENSIVAGNPAKIIKENVYWKE